MIKINLLKEGPQRKGAHGLPIRMLIIFAAVLITAVVIIGVVLRTPARKPIAASADASIAHVEPAGDTVPFPDTQETGRQTALPAESSGANPPPIPVPEKPAPPPEPEKVKPAVEMPSAAETLPDGRKSAFTPSTHTTPEVIENVVADRSGRNANELLSLAYREMSLGEKINYETGFAKKVFVLLTRAVPEGIGFGSLTVDSFSVIKATGFGPGREAVSRLFNELRNENLVLRERPVTSIRPVGKGGYRFDFACEAAFGIDVSETYIPTSTLKPHETFTAIFKSFQKLSARDGVLFQGEPNRISSEKAGGFRRYTYHLAGSAAYRDFVKLVLDLHEQRIPCSFARIQLKARNDAKIFIDADIIFNFLD